MRMKSELAAGRVMLGYNVTFASAGIVESIAGDWHWIWIDWQHGEHDYRSVLECVRAAEFMGVNSLVRVPANDRALIGMALDTGTSGVIVPQVDTVDDAMYAACAAKFPPVGNRSYGGLRVYNRGGGAYWKTANDDTMLVVQTESRAAVENAPGIFAVDGVDAFFLGPDDLALSEGRQIGDAASFGHDDSCIRELVALADMAGVIPGGAFEGRVARAAELGYRLIAAGGDVGVLKTASSVLRAEIDGGWRRSMRQSGCANDP